METADDRGAPAGKAEPKRPADNVPLRVDWHDYLINRRTPGVAVALNFRFRFPRDRSTGLQYKCTVAGVSDKRPDERIVWPTTAGGVVTDGPVQWTAEAIDTQSLRLTISSNAWSVNDAAVTLATQSNADSIYTSYASGGADGQTYEIRHSVTLSNGEIKEALIVLPVLD